MLTHPKDSPLIYLKNESIIERHINAAIFQAFFKRMNYDLSRRRFSGMGAPEHEANLMESMGTLDGFFSNSPDSEFNYSNFCDWLEGKKASINENPCMAWVRVRPQIESILQSSRSMVTLDDLLLKLREFLDRSRDAFQKDGG